MQLSFNVMQLIKMALAEDIGTGDVTSQPMMRAMGEGKYAFIAKEKFILAGTDIVHAVFKEIDPDIVVSFKHQDGDKIEKDSRFGSLSGNISSILMGERVALNFMQRLSGIATETSNVVKTLLTSRTGGTSGHTMRILDTRKTTPGWRNLEKYAVRVGGGANNRFGLYDAVVIKENHVAAAGNIGDAVALIRPRVPVNIKIEVEAKCIQDVEEALIAGADIILLHDMDMQTIAHACKLIGNKAATAITGVTPETLAQYSKFPVDYISIDSLTQNVRCVDITLKKL